MRSFSFSIHKKVLVMLLFFLAVSACLHGAIRQYQFRAAESLNQENANLENTNSNEEKKYIKWVEFNVTKDALQQAYEYDTAAHDTDCPLNWVELLSYLAARYGGDFSRYKASDMTELVQKLENGQTMEELTKDMEYYAYYRQAYGAVLDGMVGEYQVKENGNWTVKYGLKAFHPIARGFPYSDYDDFGVSRSYGYKRNHLGHDMMGQVGTPIVAVESGIIYHLGWNQYGGWRIGINSFDGKVKDLVLIGQTREKIAEAAVSCGFPEDHIHFCENLKEAVHTCAEKAVSGDAVLLSPACASWGQFDNYEQRGDLFKEYVRSL